jgi:tripartite ATP-independent transporter DctP family solute receptor
MRREMTSFFVGGLFGVVLTTIGLAVYLNVAGGRGDGAGVRVLVLGHGLDPSHPVHQAMVRMDERLRDLSGGRLAMTIHPSEQLGTEVQCVEQVQAGSMDLTKTSTGPLESFVPEMTLFGVPYVFRDEGHFWRVAEGEIGQRLLMAGRERGLVGLCFYDAGARSFYTISRPIRTPEDLRGLKIRVQSSVTAMNMVETLGGLPTPIAWGELYTALQQRMIDGAENNPPSLLTSRQYEVARHYSLDEHTRTPDILLISAKTWESLSEQERGWVRQAAAESSAYQRELWRMETERCMQALRDAGVTIHEVDKAAFARAVEPMMANFSPEIRQLIEQVKQIP